MKLLAINYRVAATVAAGVVLLAGVARTASGTFSEQWRAIMDKAAADQKRLGLTRSQAKAQYPTPEIGMCSRTGIAPGATGELSASGKFQDGTAFLFNNPYVEVLDQKVQPGEYHATVRLSEEARNGNPGLMSIMLVAVAPVSTANRSCVAGYVDLRAGKKAASAPPVTPPQTPAPVAAVTAAPAPATPAAKKPGVVRIGIAMPRAQWGQGTQGPSAGEPVRGVLSQYLSGPTLEAVSLAALLPQQVEAEAREKQCDYVVYSSMRGATTLGSYAPSMGSARGVAGTIGVASAATGATVSAQQSAAVSSSVRSKSEVTFEYALHAPGNPAALVSNSYKAKAQTDGEDVVTPLIEQAASAVLARVTAR